jgi:hypothetical protein
MENDRTRAVAKRLLSQQRSGEELLGSGREAMAAVV